MRCYYILAAAADLVYPSQHAACRRDDTSSPAGLLAGWKQSI